VLGFEYTLRGVLELFFRCQIFDFTDKLSTREFLDKQGAKEVSRTLADLQKVFYKPIEKELEDNGEIDEEAVKRVLALKLSALPGVEFIDGRHK
jgi:hypothetical protein